MDKTGEIAAVSGPKQETGVPGSGAIDEIYLAHAPIMRRVAIRKFGIPPPDADGLVHDVFLNYLIRTRVVHNDLRAYLLGAICNASRNYWRSRRSEAQLFANEEEGIADVLSEDLFEGLAINLAVASTLAGLGARCREVLRRYYLNGEDTASIAVAMNTTPSNVNYMMHVCRKRARGVYESIARGRS